MTKFELLREVAMPTTSVAPRRMGHVPTGPGRPARVSPGDPVQAIAYRSAKMRVTSVRAGVATASDGEGTTAAFWVDDLEWIDGSWSADRNAKFHHRAGTEPVSMSIEPAVIGVGR